MDEKHRKAISEATKGHKVSEETRRKIGLANSGLWIGFNCDYCGKHNSENQSHFNKSKRHFCNQKCYSKYRQEIMPSSEQPTWKGGITRTTQIGRGNKQYKEWQRAVFVRDGNKCVWCGSNERLEADHIKRWSTHSELRYEISNGRTLCMKCHNKTRNKKFYENKDLLGTNE